MAEVVWRPSPEVLERANVVRLMRRHGFEDFGELLRRSQEDPEWFWPAVVEDLGLEFSRPWDAVVDLSRGPEWATWFVGGRLNIAHNCAHRWAARTPAATACVSLGEDGRRRSMTYAELSDEVTRLAEALTSLGVEAGDRVAIFLPMSQEVAVASHACAHIGAVQVPIFSGFAAPAVAQRLQASEAKVAITTRTSLRRGRELPMLEILEEARAEAPALAARRPRPVGRAARRAARRAAARRARLGGALPAHVHIGDDRPAERRRPRAGRISWSRSRARSVTRPTRGPGT